MNNLTAIVTGGTRGIGRAIVDAFLDSGYRVATCSRSARPADLPRSVLYHVLDVRDRRRHIEWIADVKKRFGRLDTLVNCAGESRWRPLEAVDELFVDDVLNAHVHGTLWACQAALPYFKQKGCIVNLSSLAGKRGSANNSVYCAAKFAVNGLTQALAKELGPRGIRVNAVCPVYVKTDHLVDSLSDSASPAKRQPVMSYLKNFASTQTALGRLPRAQEVARTVLFLASPAASAITGQCLNVDCGTLPQ